MPISRADKPLPAKLRLLGLGTRVLEIFTPPNPCEMTTIQYPDVIGVGQHGSPSNQSRPTSPGHAVSRSPRTSPSIGRSPDRDDFDPGNMSAFTRMGSDIFPSSLDRCHDKFSVSPKSYVNLSSPEWVQKPIGIPKFLFGPKLALVNE